MADGSVTRNTPGSSNTGTDYIAEGKSTNVLNKYRLSTYNFTLSALRRTNVSDPDTYRKSTEDFVILKSGGKGYAGLTNDISPVERTYTPPAVKSTSTNGTVTSKTTNNVTTSTTQKWEDKSGGDLVAGFNKNSPGRFDMFIDNVEVETLMGFSEQGGTTQPTKFTFDVFEPYSINGFLEALHVSSIAAGYPTYTNATFLLKVEFIGYPDTENISDPEPIDMSSRYFPITLTNLEVTIDEKGTKYAVTAIASNERAFGNPSQLRKPVKIEGSTVQDIIKNLMDSVNDQVKEAAKKGRTATTGNNDYDEYKVKFPVWNDQTGFTGGEPGGVVNKIAQSKVAELLKDNAVYKFPDPGTNTKPTANQPKGQTNPTPEQNQKRPESYKLSPSAPVVQFPEGKNINDCISAIIKDSKYVRDIVEKLSSESEWKTVVDADGMVDYFLIKVEVTNKDTIDTATNKPYQIYTFVVTPFKILYTRIPNYGSQQVDIGKLTKCSIRAYDYIYTGNNVDIINFKLNFNTLFFEAIPDAMGNTNTPPPRDAAARGNKTEPRLEKDDLSRNEARGLPSARVMPDPQATSVDKDSANQRQDDAYFALAKGMHKAITDAKGSMIQGDVEILGDPVYLVTGGIGNYNPKPSGQSARLTQDGEAAFNYGEVLIVINFRNPIDIDPLEKGGMLYFEPKLTPFSGVYRVNRVRSTFKDGIFKQHLEVIRQPGQPFPTTNPSAEGVNAPSVPARRTPTQAKAGDVVSADITPAETVVNTDTGVSGDRASTLNLMTQINRGLPSPGLPGALSNFTAAQGGLGGTVSLLQVSGATPNLAGNTRIATQIFGGVVPGGVNQNAMGMPLPAKAVPGLQGRVLSPAGVVNQVGQSIAGSFGLKGVAASVAGQVIGMATTKIRRTGILGSGIGVGVTVPYTPSTTPPQTSYDIVSRPQSSPITSVPTTGMAQGLDNYTLAAVANLPGGPSGSINNVESNVRSATQGNSADPYAVASQFGINQSQLSGLSPNLQSKVLNQLTGIGNNVPADTNLAQASAQGINLRGLNGEGISNLPPTAPYTTAPGPAPDSGFLNRITSSGGVSALAKAFGVNSVNEIPQTQLPSENVNEAVSNAPSSIGQKQSLTALPPNIVDTAAGVAKYLTANSQIAGLTGILGSREGDLYRLANRYPGSPVNVTIGGGNDVINKFGSKTSGKSPLDKIMIR